MGGAQVGSSGFGPGGSVWLLQPGGRAETISGPGAAWHALAPTPAGTAVLAAARRRSQRAPRWSGSHAAARRVLVRPASAVRYLLDSNPFAASRSDHGPARARHARKNLACRATGRPPERIHQWPDQGVPRADRHRPVAGKLAALNLPVKLPGLCGVPAKLLGIPFKLLLKQWGAAHAEAPGAGTLTRVSPRKRDSRKRKTHRQGVSGNPQRRAQQLQERRMDQGKPALRELAYRLVGGAPAAPWWRDSYKCILARARTLTWPSCLVDLETQACRIVGDEFYDRLQSPGTGLHPVQWLRALAEETGAALRMALAQGADDWQGLWALLCGLAMMTPRTSADTVSEAVLGIRKVFPDIKDPYETALTEVGKAAKLLANRGLEPGVGRPAGGFEPAGEPLVARDIYGSRFLLAAPFSYSGGGSDHWYVWDADLCWITVVVGAGVFASAEDALRDWRDAVGPAASGAALSPCTAGMTARLLAPCTQTGILADMLEGAEPRELIHEHYRLQRRARDLAGSADAQAGSSPFSPGHVQDAFLDWHATRHGEGPAAAAEAVGTILSEWGPHETPDERSFYACSPHRIEMAAHLIRKGYYPDDANAALRLLPEWTQWCIEQTGLDGAAAARSREAARSATSVLVGDEADDIRPARHPD